MGTVRLALAESAVDPAVFGPQDKLKHRTSRCIPGNPQPSLVGLDDRAADRQTHAHTGRFCREERIEYATDILRADTFSSVRH
jgi:hypothetical protein